MLPALCLLGRLASRVASGLFCYLALLFFRLLVLLLSSSRSFWLKGLSAAYAQARTSHQSPLTQL